MLNAQLSTMNYKSAYQKLLTMASIVGFSSFVGKNERYVVNSRASTVFALLSVFTFMASLIFIASTPPKTSIGGILIKCGVFLMVTLWILSGTKFQSASVVNRGINLRFFFLIIIYIVALLSCLRLPI